MSAVQGNKFARSNIGYMYANGHGVYKDYILSYIWTNLAATQGNKIGGKIE
jgi:TPR repeat protein